MVLRRYSNTAADTTINGAITASSTSLLATSASNYPSVPFTVSVEDEIILVGAKSGTTFSDLTRGYDSTVATSHVDGSTMRHVAVADDFSYRWQDTTTVPTWHSLDDEFDDASLDSAWTEVTPSGTVNWTEARGVLSCRFTEQTASDACGLVKNMGSLVPPVYLTTAVRLFSTHENYGMVGLIFSDGTATTSNLVWNAPYANTSNWTMQTIMRAGTFTNVSSNLTTGYHLHANYPWLHLRLDWQNSNTWRAWYSPDGVSWDDLDQGAKSSTMTPTHIGIGVSTWDTTIQGSQIATFQHFRVYESKPSWWYDGT